VEEGHGADHHDEAADGHQPPTVKDPSPHPAADLGGNGQYHEADAHRHDQQTGECHVPI